MWKKLISLNLALIMIFSLLPLHALAAEETTVSEEETLVYVDDGETVSAYTPVQQYDVTADELRLYLSMPELEKEGYAAAYLTVDGTTVDYYPGRSISIDPDGDRTISVDWKEMDGLFIRYVDEAGSSAYLESYGEGGSVTLADQHTFTTDDGLRVIYWMTTRGGYSGTTAGTAYTLSASTTLYARMGAGVITLHNTADGTSTTTPYSTGSRINSAPSRSSEYDSTTGTTTYYKFAGWNSAEDGSGDWYTSYDAVSDAPADLYSQWLSYTSGESVYFLSSASGAILESGKQLELYALPDSGSVTLPSALKNGTVAFWQLSSRYYPTGGAVDASELSHGVTFRPTALETGTYLFAVDGEGISSECLVASASGLTLRHVLSASAQMGDTQVITGLSDSKGTTYSLTDSLALVCTGLDETGGAVILTPAYQSVTGNYIFYSANGGTDEDGLDYAIQDGLTLDGATAFTVEENPFTYPEGKVFVGWYSNNWNTAGWYMPGDSVTTFTANTHLTAQWATYGRFTCHYTDASGEEYSSTHTDALLYRPTRDDGIFIGWNTEEDGSGDWYAYPSDIVTYNYKHGTVVDLYAQWESYPASGTDYVVVRGRFANGTVAGLLTAENGSITFPASSDMASDIWGWSSSSDYAGWTDDSSFVPAGTASTGYSSGGTYYSVAAGNSITYHGNGATTAGGADTRTYVCNSTLSNLTLYPYYNVFSEYFDLGVFRQWNTEANGSGTAYTETYIYMPPAAYDLYAIWAKYISLSQTEATLTQGSVLQLSADVSDEAGDITVCWSTSNSSVATVNSSGLVTAVGGGIATIQAYFWLDNEHYSATCEITVPTSVTLSEDGSSTIWVDNNQTYTVTATVDESLADQSVTWSSSDENVAVVSADGNTCTVIPKGTGSVYITATAADGTSASCRIYFQANLYISDHTWSMNVGNTYPFTATSYLDDTTVTWASSDEAVATIDKATGLVTALKGGTTTITATAADGTFVTTTLTVRYNTTIQPSFSKTTLWTGNSTRFGVYCEGYENGLEDLTWSTDNTDSITLTETLLDQEAMEGMTDEELEETYVLLAELGYDPDAVMAGKYSVPVFEVTAKATGTTRITFTGTDGNSATVTILVRSFVIEDEDDTLVPGETTTVTAVDRYHEEVSVTWESADESIATVDEDGLVTAVSTGTAVITATDKNGITATWAVSVVDIRIKNDRTTVYPGGTVQLEAVINPALEGQTVIWSSSNTNAATVDQNGVVTGVKDGYSARVTATLPNGSSATARVEVRETFQHTEDYLVIHTGGGASRYPGLSLHMCGVGDESDLTLTMSDPSVATAAITWFDGDEEWSFAEVYITALKNGVTTLTITAANGASTQTVISVTDMAMSRESAVLVPGEALSLSVTGGEALTWASSDESVATVDESGAVTAISCGDAVITATAADGSFVMCEVDVEPYRLDAEGLQDGHYLLLLPGETRQAGIIFDQELYSSVTSVTWKSYDKTVATVSETGLITAVGEGGTEIEVCIQTETGAWYYDYFVVEVMPGLELSQSSMTVGKSQDRFLYIYYYGEDVADVEWNVKGTTVISVEEDDSMAPPVPEGCQTITLKVTGKKAGSATITVEAPDGTEATCTVTVTSFYIASPENLTLVPGEKLTLEAIEYDGGDDADVDWSSSDKSILTVSSKGVVTAKATGKATVTAEASDGSTEEVTFKVVSLVLRREDNDTATYVGGKITLEPALSDDLDAADLTWSSSDDTIAKVSQKGIVTGVSLGRAKITVTAPDGTSSSLWVEVCPQVTIDASASELTILSAGGWDAQYGMVLTGCDLEDLAVSVSDPQVISARVTEGYEDGWAILWVTPLARGLATVTVTAPNGDSVSVPVSVTDYRIVLGQTGNLVVGEEMTVTLVDKDGNVVSAEWELSDPLAGTLTDGIFTATAPGYTTITATDVDGIITFYDLDVYALRVENPIRELKLGQSHTFDVTLGTGYTEYEIIATFGDLNVLDIDGDTITAVNPGTTLIHVTIPGGAANSRIGHFQYFYITVPSENVTLDQTEVTLAQGKTVTLKATVQNLSSTKVTWSSDNTDVATVSSSGKVTPKAAGTAIITATATDGSTASCTVTVTQVAKSLSVFLDGEAATKATLAARVMGEDTLHLTAALTDKVGDFMALPEGTAITWASAKTSVAVVDENGLVTAIATGSAKITASAVVDGKTMKATCTVTVEQLPTGLAITPGEGEVVEGKTLTLKAVFAPAKVTNDDVVWTSSDESIATVSSAGKVKGVSGGTVTITAASEADPNLTASCTVTVVPTELMHSSITIYTEDNLSKKVSSLTVGAGKETQLVSVVLNSSKKELTDALVFWTSSDETVATVDETGLITGLASGKTTITATTSQGKSAKVTVTVEVFPEFVTIYDGDDNAVNPSEALSIGQGQSLTLSALAGPMHADDTSVVWETGDKTIATVSKGKITVVKTAPAGSEVTITARASANDEAYASVTVVVTPVTKSLSVFNEDGEGVTKLAFVAANPGDSVQLTAALTDLAGDAMTGDYDITWTSAKASVATVDETGVVTAAAKGSAKITATYVDPDTSKKYTATCTVTITWMSDQVTTTLDSTEQAVSMSKTLTLKAAASRADGLAVGNDDVVWSTSDESIAAVTTAGKVTGKGIGTCTITAEAADGSGAYLEFTVTVTPYLTKVTASPTSEEIGVTGSRNLKEYLTITFKDLEYSEDLEQYLSYTFTSSKESVATVDENGIVTVHNTGSAKITIKVTCGSVTKSVTFTVKGVVG